MALQESGEMYIEAIYILSQRSTAVRSIDVAEYLGYSKPSVSRAIGVLKQKGLVRTDESGHLILTDEGLRLGMRIYERHTVLTRALLDLGIDEQTASEDACRVEHYISDTTFEAIKAHVTKYDNRG